MQILTKLFIKIKEKIDGVNTTPIVHTTLTAKSSVKGSSSLVAERSDAYVLTFTPTESIDANRQGRQDLSALEDTLEAIGIKVRRSKANQDIRVIENGPIYMLSNDKKKVQEIDRQLDRFDTYYQQARIAQAIITNTTLQDTIRLNASPNAEEQGYIRLYRNSLHEELFTNMFKLLKHFEIPVRGDADTSKPTPYIHIKLQDVSSALERTANDQNLLEKALEVNFAIEKIYLSVGRFLSEIAKQDENNTELQTKVSDLLVNLQDIIKYPALPNQMDIFQIESQLYAFLKTEILELTSELKLVLPAEIEQAIIYYYCHQSSTAKIWSDSGFNHFIVAKHKLGENNANFAMELFQAAENVLETSKDYRRNLSHVIQLRANLQKRLELTAAVCEGAKSIRDQLNKINIASVCAITDFTQEKQLLGLTEKINDLTQQYNQQLSTHISQVIESNLYLKNVVHSQDGGKPVYQNLYVLASAASKSIKIDPQDIAKYEEELSKAQKAAMSAEAKAIQTELNTYLDKQVDRLYFSIFHGKKFLLADLNRRVRTYKIDSAKPEEALNFMRANVLEAKKILAEHRFSTYGLFFDRERRTDETKGLKHMKEKEVLNKVLQQASSPVEAPRVHGGYQKFRTRGHR